MKFFASAAVAAIALASSLAIAEPASARSNVGVYVGPGGVSISVDTYKRYCRDEYYRRNHWDRCSRFYGNGRDYPNAYERHHGRYKHWDRGHRRWYWDDNRW